MRRVQFSPLVLCLALISFASAELQSQNDPGPRSGPATAGSYFLPLSPNEQALFNQAQLRFQEIDSVSGGISGESGSGLGPTFNGNSCAQCHAQPTIGGSSPGLTSPQNSVPNPQVALAALDGATQLGAQFHHCHRSGARSALHQELRMAASMAECMISTRLPAAPTLRAAISRSPTSPRHFLTTT